MTKIDIISGFLGAGKTTFIKKLLQEAIAGEQVVLIENEFGEIGIDGGFLKDSGIEIREMNSGCICCSLVGDFGKSLEEVLTTYKPERVIIEPSGVGKLSDVMNAVRNVAKNLDVKLNSAVTVVDAAKCKMYMKNFGEFFNNQVESAGTIVLSRTDIADPGKVAQDVIMLREKNPTASIVTTPIDQLTGAQLLELIEKPDTMMEELLAQVKEEHEHHHDHDGCCCHDHHHEHQQHNEECNHDKDEAEEKNVLSCLNIMASANLTTSKALYCLIMTIPRIMTTSITMITTGAAITTMIITIIMRMRSLRAGVWRMWEAFPARPLTVSCSSWLMVLSLARYCVRRAWFRARQRVSGCILIWFRKSMRSVPAPLSIQERYA